MIEIIPNERAMFISDLNAVVVADLHIGYEMEMRKEGIKIPNYTGEMIARLKRIIEKKNAEMLIILVDVKHSIGECRDVKELENLDAEIRVVKGNHDGGIESLLSAKIYPAGGFRLGDYGFIHGHSWPNEEVMHSEFVFMGHLHPEIELRDSNGHAHRYACHLKGSLTEEGKKKYGAEPKIFVVAAFNPMVGSSLATPLGPLMRNRIIGNFEVYLTDGTYLGKLADIQHQGWQGL